MWRTIKGRVERFASLYRGEKFHAMLCDPPYELGFMGKKWDDTGVAFRPETWAALGEHLYPGAFGMAFGGARTSHRMAVAIEDAGFIIHPTVYLWAFGSGFPKATRIDTQIDRDAGKSDERKSVGKYQPPGMNSEWNLTQASDDRQVDMFSSSRNNLEIMESATELGRAWQEHRYGLQALSPAVEPIIVFQKPYEGRPVDNMVETGAGALWIDGARIGTGDDRCNGGKSGAIPSSVLQDGFHQERMDRPIGGRWPSNLVIQHHPDCSDGCHPDCAVRRLGKQRGETVSSGGSGEKSMGGLGKQVYGSYALDRHAQNAGGLGDSGSVSRYFFNADWSHEIQEGLFNADPVFYCPKASTAERNAGLDGNSHPTIKPIALTKWLATLLLPPAAYAPRRILVPFAGVGSEMIGALLAGWDTIIGIEMVGGYVNINRKRVGWWEKEIAFGSNDPAAIVKDANERKKVAGQQRLF